MPQKFVILSMPRSGSGFLYTTLDSHPDFMVHGELFLRRRMGALSSKMPRLSRQKLRMELTTEWRDENPLEFLERVFGYDVGKPFLGFKLFFPQNEKALRLLIADSDVKKIVLQRENILALYSSARTAQASGQGKVPVGENVEKRKIVFEEDDYCYFRDRHAKFVGLGCKLLKSSAQEFLKVEYTELAKKEKFDQIFDFLGAPKVEELTSGVVKRNPSNILDRFENPETVEQFLHRIGRPEWVNEDM